MCVAKETCNEDDIGVMKDEIQNSQQILVIISAAFETSIMRAWRKWEKV